MTSTKPLRWIYLKMRHIMIMKRQRTVDRDATPVLTVEQLGPRQSKTPEGFLLCEAVPIARVGLMLYGPRETPIAVGRDGIARVTRDAAALFHDDTIASFNGKPVVNEHPDVDVRPDNWRKLTIGIVLNPRRGEGDDHDVILGELLITDASAIRDVEAGKREVSAGYEADYEQTGDGEGKQTNIIGNHVALVERGRCGPRCAIGDHQSPSIKESSTMGTATVRSGNRARRPIPEAVRKLFKDAMETLEQDPTALDAPGDQTPPGDADGDNHTHIHIHTGSGDGGEQPPPGGGEEGMEGAMTQDDPIEARFQALEAQHGQLMEQIAALTEQIAALTGGGEEGSEGGEEEPPPPDGGEEEMPPPEGSEEELPPTTRDSAMMDSAALERAYTGVISDAEILIPGYRVATFDARKPRKVTMDTMCAMRRRILDQFYATSDGKIVIDNITGGGIDASRASCADAAVLFKAAAGAKRMLNNASATRDSGVRFSASVTQPGAVGGITSIAALNELHRKHYAGKPPAAK